MVAHDGQLRSRVERLVYDNGWLRRRHAAKVRARCIRIARFTAAKSFLIRLLFLTLFKRPKDCIVSARSIPGSGGNFVLLSACLSLDIFFPIASNLSCPSTFETSRAGARLRARLAAFTEQQQNIQQVFDKPKITPTVAFFQTLLVAVVAYSSAGSS